MRNTKDYDELVRLRRERDEARTQAGKTFAQVDAEIRDEMQAEQERLARAVATLLRVSSCTTGCACCKEAASLALKEVAG
jgi:hypothetical protein